MDGQYDILGVLDGDNVTFATLRALVRTQTQESSTTPLATAIINDLLNEAQRELATLVEYSSATFTVTGGLVLNQYDYALTGTGAGTMLTILAVAVNSTSSGSLRAIPEVTQQQMDESFPTWRYDDAGQPVRWWRRANAIWIHPKPSASWASTPLEVRATRIPPDLSADGDTPTDLPDAFHKSLAQYATWQWMTNDKENPSGAQWAQYWEKRWMQSVAKFRQIIEGRSVTDGPMLRVGISRDGSDGFIIDEGRE